MELVVGRGLEARVVDGFNLRVGLEELRDFQRIVNVALNAQRQGLDALLNEEGIEGRGSTANISQANCTCTNDVGKVCSELLGAQVMSENKARVGRFGFIETGETLRVLRVVEVTGINNCTRNCGSVPTQVLRGRVNNNVGAPFDWPGQVGGGDSVVNDQGNTNGVCGLCDLLNVKDVALGVGDGFTVEGNGVFIGKRQPFVHIVGVAHEAGIDSEATQGVVEQRS